MNEADIVQKNIVVHILAVLDEKVCVLNPVLSSVSRLPWKRKNGGWAGFRKVAYLHSPARMHSRPITFFACATNSLTKAVDMCLMASRRRPLRGIWSLSHSTQWNSSARTCWWERSTLANILKDQRASEHGPYAKPPRGLQVVIVATLQIGVSPLLALEAANHSGLLGALIIVDAGKVLFVPDELAVLAAATLVLELGPGLDVLEVADLDGAI